jgi:hypothetical protein
LRSAYGHKETPEEVVQLPVPIPGFVDDYAFTIQVGIIKNYSGEKYADHVHCNRCSFLQDPYFVSLPDP